MWSVYISKKTFHEYVKLLLRCTTKLLILMAISQSYKWQPFKDMAVCRIDINTRGSCKQKNNLSCHLSRPVWELFLFAITWQEGQFKHLFMLNQFSVVLDVQSGRKTVNFLNNVAALLKRTTRRVKMRVKWHHGCIFLWSHDNWKQKKVAFPVALLLPHFYITLLNSLH